LIKLGQQAFLRLKIFECIAVFKFLQVLAFTISHHEHLLIKALLLVEIIDDIGKHI